MKSNLTITSPSRRAVITAWGTLAVLCCLVSFFTAKATAEEGEPELVEAPSFSFVVVRQSFKNGERIEWTAYELASPISFTPKSAKNYANDPRLGTINRGITALDEVKRSEDSKKVVIPATGASVTSGELEGEMSLLFVVNGDSCVGYSTQDEISIKSVRKFTWTTFE